MIKKRDTLIQPRISASFFEINILSYRSRESILLRTEGAISEIVLEMLVQFLHSFDDSRMHLADATLAQIQSRTDFFHRHFFIVVKDDNHTFFLSQPLRALADDFSALKALHRSLALFIGQDVDFGDVAVAGRIVPFFVEARHINPIGVNNCLSDVIHGLF